MRKILLFILASGGIFSPDPTTANPGIYADAAPFVEKDKTFDPGGLTQAFEKVGLGRVMQQIPAHGQGTLMAPWSPSTDPVRSPTFVILHGGGGIGSMHIKMALDLKNEFDANVLILDSHWARGRKSNVGPDFRRYSRMISATDRVHDLIASGEWLAKKGINPKLSYILGESQGGMVVMRALTENTGFSGEVKKYFSRGIVLWPACVWWDSDHTRAHPIGPFHSPLLVISGGRDYGSPISECSPVKHATKHLHWEEATHAWMIATHGPYREREDGNCDAKTESKNQKIDICYSEARTKETWRIVKDFLK